MKRMGRSDSPETLMEKSGSTDVLTYKLESFSKSFRKKYHGEPTTLSSTNLIKNFSKTRVRPLCTRDSPPKPSDRRSHSKGNHQRPIEKVSLTGQAYTHVHQVPTTVKLMKVLAIFERRGKGGAEAVEALRQQNEEYFDLLMEWQKLEIYDQIDRLVFKLTQKLTHLLFSALQNAYGQFDAKLQRYESLASRLHQDNQRLITENNQLKEAQHQLSEVKRRTTEEYHKNQWSNAILQHVRRTGVDLDTFIRKVPLYKYFVYGNQPEEDFQHQEALLIPRANHRNGDKSEANFPISKSEVIQQINSSYRPQKVGGQGG